MIRAIVLLTVFGTITAYGQGTSPRFDVASVKLSPAGATKTAKSQRIADHGRLTMLNVTLKGCILAAYGTKDYQLVGGPSWFDSDRYNIVAKTDLPVADSELLIGPCGSTCGALPPLHR